jgi:hypothetical protein
MYSHRKKLLLTLLLLGAAAAVAGFATFSAFSATTTNSNNQFAAGSVVIGDNDGVTGVMYAVSNQKPSVPTVKCIKVTYTGSLDADVKLYTTTTTIPAAATNLTLTIDKGTSDTSTFPTCGTFTSQATIYTGSLRGFQTSHNAWSNGVAAYPGAATKWTGGSNEDLWYRFTVTANDSANGLDSGLHQFTWEAQNQP